MISKLPNEIWLNISDILGKSGHIRTMINLQKSLCWKNMYNYNKKFIQQALNTERRICKKNYNEQMIEFWEKTGIDDGVPIEYVITRDFQKRKMYKTIWSNEFVNDIAINIYVYKDHTQEIVLKYTDKIFLDRRKISYDSSKKFCPCNDYIKFYDNFFKNISKRKCMGL